MTARDFVIVGGGVAGLSLAYELSKLGADVALVDRVPAGAGRAPAAAVGPRLPAAILNPHRGRSARAHPADLAGLEAFWRLADELAAAGLDPAAHRTGVLRVATSTRQAGSWRRLVADGAGLRWLEEDAVPAGVHAPHGALLVERGGWVEPAALLGALTSASNLLGASLWQGVQVGALAPSPGGAEVTTTAGPLAARHVVLCLGAAEPPAGCRLPALARDGGAAAVLRLPGSAHVRLSGAPPVAGAVNAVIGAGHAVVTGGTLSPVSPPEPELRLAALRLRDSAAWTLPGLRDAELMGAWFGVRARRPSGRPVVRRLSERVTLYGALAGRGYLCAADLSARLARRLLT